MGNICSTETRVLLRAPHEHGIYINSWHSFPELRRIKAPRAGFLDQIKLPHKLERVGSSPRLLSPPARVTGAAMRCNLAQEHWLHVTGTLQMGFEQSSSVEVYQSA